MVFPVGIGWSRCQASATTTTRSAAAALIQRTGWRVEGRPTFRNESIPAARQRLDVQRVLRVVAEGGAGLQNAEVEAALEVDERLVAPHLAAKLLAGHELAGTAGQREQEAERLRRERHDLAVAAKLAAARVERVRSEPDRLHENGHRTPI